jgi:hypothetical protein
LRNYLRIMLKHFSGRRGTKASSGQTTVAGYEAIVIHHSAKM